MIDLDAIEARANAATEGPWWASNKYAVCIGTITAAEYIANVWDGEYIENPNGEADAAFIAAARTDVPALVAEVRRLRAALENTELTIAKVLKATGMKFAEEEEEEE